MRSSQFSRDPPTAVANSQETDGRIGISYYCMANLIVCLLKVGNLRTVDCHLRYSGKLRSLMKWRALSISPSFKGPHLYAGMAIVSLWAMAAGLVGPRG
jgi:hypothetical protein